MSLLLHADIAFWNLLSPSCKAPWLSDRTGLGGFSNGMLSVVVSAIVFVISKGYHQIVEEVSTSARYLARRYVGRPRGIVGVE